jgi:hypothetical protein
MLSTYVRRAAIVIAIPFVAAGVVSVACSDDAVRYGPPNGLQGKTPNDQLAASSGGGSSTSSSGGTDGGGGCTPPPAEAGADCPTFTTMWNKYFSVAGEWKCGNGTGCHGAGGNQPQPLTDQAASYTLLQDAGVSIGSKAKYINPKCIEDTQSSITCNIAQKPSVCGLAAMPSGITPSAASLADLAKWVSCGAPGP